MEAVGSCVADWFSPYRYAPTERPVATYIIKIILLHSLEVFIKTAIKIIDCKMLQYLTSVAYDKCFVCINLILQSHRFDM